MIRTLLLLLALPAVAHSQEDSAATPPAKRGLIARTEAATGGLTLFAPLASHSTYLIDDEGEVVHQWGADFNPGSMVYLRDNGNLVRGGHVKGSGRFHGGGMGGVLQEFNWDGELVWHYELASDGMHQHHDVELMPNGNLLLIGWEAKSREEVLAHGRDPRAVGEDGLWPDMILEIRPTRPKGAEVVWEWHTWDHIIQDFDDSKPGYGSVPEHPGRLDVNGDHRDQPPITAAERQRLREQEEQMRALGYANGGEDGEEEESPSDEDLRRLQSPDWMHTNGVSYIPALDLIAFSSHRFSEVFVIDHSTTSEQAAGSSGGRYGKGGDFLWRWGNPRHYGAGTDGDRALFSQHDPTWILGRNARPSLLIFNNGAGRPGGNYSSVVELALPFDPNTGFARTPGEPFGPKAPAWSYESPDDFFGSFISGAQRLWNGNTLICCGPEGRVFEVTSAGEVVWDYHNPFGGEEQFKDEHPEVPPHAVFRAHRYAPDHPAFKGRF